LSGKGYEGLRLYYIKEQEEVCIAKGKGAVASVSRNATDLAINILKDGGNAFDAAFALAFSLTIYHPQAGNIGGGGYLVFKEKDSKIPGVINYREIAPSMARREYFIAEDGSADPEKTAFGPLSICVPGTVKAFFHLQKEYGLMNSKDILLKLASLAREGYPVTAYQAACLNRLSQKLSFSPESYKLYVKKEGKFIKGDLLTNEDLASTFEVLARDGEKAFYRGLIAEKIEKDITSNGGFLTAKDLENYSIKEVKPIYGEIMGKKVWTVPPEGGGAILVEILNILDREQFYKLNPLSGDFFHYLSQASKMAFIDRQFYQGDVNLKDNITYNSIFNHSYCDFLFKLIDSQRDIKTESLMEKMGRSKKQVFPDRNSQTTHFCVVDKDGNAISNSYTLNLRYGSKWSIQDAGFLMNGSIDAFSFTPGKPNYFGVIGNDANLFSVCKRPASNMAPVIVIDDEKKMMLLGTPGGPAIPTTLAIILMAFYNGVAFPEAVKTGRVHHQALPDRLMKEIKGLPEKVIEELIMKGYEIKDKDELIGDVHGILVTEDGCIAVSDFRREGYASAI